MTDKDPCPETARVQVMVEGTLSDEDQGAMALHLEDCEPCQERFEELMREVDCFSEVARELGGELRTQDTALEQVIQALHAKGTGQKDGGELSDEATDGEPVSSEDLSLDFLDPSDDPDHLGRLGPYEVIEVVGRGGMGVVLKGHDHRLNRVVAIKVLHPRLAINATARKRFRRESRAAAAVSHDHVVTIHAVEEVDGLPILVMEYVEGVSLQQRIKENGPLMLEEILRVSMQAASGLAAAHAQGITHRDVKPSNILLENGVERVKLTDFGLARAVDDVHLTKSGVLAGTPEYMSPEQAHGEPVDGRSDLFSLGCVLYACCTGRSPFRADSTMAALRRVCEDTPRPIQEINPDIPDWLVEIIDRLLAKDREERFESASDVAELLGGHLAHSQQPSVVPQPARLKPPAGAGRWRPGAMLRRRWIAAAAAAVLVLVVGMGVTEGTGLTRVVATVIELWTPHGTLIIETDDPDIEIAISGDGEEVIFTGAGVRRITVPMDVLFDVKGKKDGNTIFHDVVRITRNGERVTRVRVAPPELEGPTPLVPPAPITTSLISGMVFHDGNGNGLRELDEPGLAHSTIELQQVVTVNKPLMTIPNPHPEMVGRGVPELFGHSLAIHGDRFFVGDPHDKENGGAVFMFDGLTGKLLKTIRSPKPAGMFGYALAVLGNHIVVGDYCQDARTGGVHVFDAKTGEFVRSLQNPSPSKFECFGVCLAVIGDDVVVGEGHWNRPCTTASTAHLFDGSTGALLRTFERPSPQADDGFGSGVAAMGKNVLIGAQKDRTGSNQGAVYLFDTQTGELLQTFHNPSSGYFARWVAALGDTVLVRTGPAAAAEGGAVYAFDSVTGRLLRTYVSPNPSAEEFFGCGVVPVGNSILIGASGPNAPSRGAVYLIDGASGALIRTYLNPYPEHERFSRCIAKMGDRFLIAAPGGKRGGTVYVFEGIPEPTTVHTDADGSYTFTEQPPGNYLVRVVAPEGYAPTAGDTGTAQTFVIDKDAPASQIDFALKTARQVGAADKAKEPLTTAELSAKLSPTVNSSNDVDPFGLAEKEGWQRVLRGLRQEVDGGSKKHWLHYKLLALLAYLDAELYQEYCNDHLDHFKDFPYRQTGEPAGTFEARSAHAALLLPGIELARIEPLMDFSESSVYRSHFVRAMYEYRTGRFDSAVQHFEVSRKSYGRGGLEYIEALHTQSLYWLAMTHHKLGNGDEATKAYKIAEIRFRQSTVPANPEVDGVPPWHDWLEAAVIRREARAVLGLGADHGGHEPTAPRDADKAKKHLTTAELSAKLSAEEQAAVAELCPFPCNILLVDRSPAKPALVGHFHYERRIRRRLQHLKVLASASSDLN